MKSEQLSDDVTIWLGDCLEILPTLKGIDHVICDPPYEDEIHVANSKGRDKETEATMRHLRNDGGVTFKTFGFDGINATRSEVAAAVTEASAGWAILFCLAEGVRAWRDDLQAADAKYDSCLFWVKPDASPRFNGQGAARGAECAVTAWCGTGYRSWNGGGKRGVFVYNCNTNRQGEHPTEKPLPLMSELVKLFTNPGQLVCDPFMGSGTTGVACVKLGRRFVGIERDQKWFDLSRRRISAALKEPNMFSPPSLGKQAFMFDKTEAPKQGPVA